MSTVVVLAKGNYRQFFPLIFQIFYKEIIFVSEKKYKLIIFLKIKNPAEKV